MEVVKELLISFAGRVEPYIDGISFIVIGVFWILMSIKMQKIKKSGSAEEKILQKNMIISGVSCVIAIISLILVLNIVLYIIKIVEGDIRSFKSIDIDLMNLAALSIIFYFSTMLSYDKYKNDPKKKKKLIDDYSKMAKAFIDEEVQ